VNVSVLIPTFQRPAKLAACIHFLARQSTDATFEVVIGLDGPCPESERAARQAWSTGLNASSPARDLRIIQCERAGYTLVRNHLLREARGQLLLSLNDDVIASHHLVNTHWQEHQRRRAAGLGKAIIVGDAPYARRPMGELDSLLDRLIRETSMVFFYDCMNTPEALAAPDKDWGFRHCFGLNFSADLAAVREVGGFLALPHIYGYDDIELGFKLTRRFNMPVLYRPKALVTHDHFYTAAALLQRERSLGRAAWAFAGANPAFALAVFGRDIRDEAELTYSREFVARERTAADRSRATLSSLEHIPADSIHGDHAAQIIHALYEQHLLLKRWEWRQGLLEAARAT
jgi:GT2 family glycosyltransferase